MHRRQGRSGSRQRPSERVRELMRQGAERALNVPPHWLEELDEATLSPGNMKVITEDPVLAAAIRRTNRANLIHWAAANVRDPGAPVAANLSPEALGIARDLVRRGVNEASLNAYRTLGDLETASPELRNTLLTFLDEGCNAARTAVRLHTHRNTLLRRLARAGELLPRPLEHNRVHVAVALEVLHWRKSVR